MKLARLTSGVPANLPLETTALLRASVARHDVALALLHQSCLPLLANSPCHWWVRIGQLCLDRPTEACLVTYVHIQPHSSTLADTCAEAI